MGLKKTNGGGAGQHLYVRK